MRCAIRTASALSLLIAFLSPIAKAEATHAPPSQGAVTGTVTSATTGVPIAGAQVFLEGTDLGTLTGSDGRYRITGVPAGTYTAVARILGYAAERRTVTVGDGESVAADFQLRIEAVALDQIVVTGTAGERRGRAVGNAVGRLDATAVTEVATPRDVQALLGSRVAGVRIRDATGEVGTGGSTSIRGVGSLTLPSEPLIYVDGVRINNEPTATGAAFAGNAGGAGPSRINEINPEDIESIEVIRGPAAATLYGTEASNGVIQIITRRGSAARSDVRVQVGQGASYLPRASTVYPTVWGLDAEGELVGLNIIENDIAQGFGSPFGTGHNQEYAASAAGGGDDLTYYLSGGFRRDEGIVSYNWKNQLTARSNLSFQPAPTVRADLNVGFVTSTTSAGSAAQPITTHLLWGLPVLEGTRNRGYLGFPPEDFEEKVEGKEDVDRTTVSLNLSHEPAAWLDHRITVGADIANVRSARLCRPDLVFGQPCAVPEGLRAVDRERANFISVDYGITGRVELTPELTASTSVGAQFHRKQFELEELEGQDLALPQLETVSATAADRRSADESFLENRTFGLYVQEQLAWRDRLFFTAALRGDDNSAFGTNFDFVVYPKLSFSWVVSEEPFLDVAALDALRLRGAWGRAGQQPDAFAAIRTYTPVPGPGGQPALTPDNVGNPDLEPEVGQELELGFDGSLWDQRLALAFTFYDQTTRKAIVARPTLPSEGFPGQQFVNIGKVGNRGFEAEARAGLLRRQDVDVRVDLSLSRNSSRVIDMGDADGMFVGALGPIFGQRHLEGFPLGGIFLPNVVNAEFDGDGNLVNVLCEGGHPITGGGAPVPCAEAGTAYIGQPVPVWVGGLATSATLFGAVELYASAEGEWGHTRLSGDAAGSHLFFRNSRCINTACDPYLAAADQIFQSGGSFLGAGIMDAGWIKLRTVSATYRLPASVTGLIRARRASVTLSGRNLLTLWTAQKESFGHRIPDPETSNADPLQPFIQEGWPHFATVQALLRLGF